MGSNLTECRIRADFTHDSALWVTEIHFIRTLADVEPNMINSEVRSGIAISVACFFWLLMEYWLGLHGKYLDVEPFFFGLILLIPLIGIYWGIKAKRDRFYHGSISFFNALKSSLIITATTSVVTPLFVWLYISAINPLYLLSLKENQLAMVRDLNIAPDSLAIREADINGTYNTLSYITSSFLFTLAVCLVISLAVSILIRKSPLKPAKDQKVIKPVEK